MITFLACSHHGHAHTIVISFLSTLSHKYTCTQTVKGAILRHFFMPHPVSLLQKFRYTKHSKSINFLKAYSVLLSLKEY